MLGVFVHPVGRDDDVEHIVEQVHLKDAIHFCGSGQRGRGVDFEQPGLDCTIYQDIVPVALKAVLVVDDDTLDGFQGDIDDVVDLLEAFVGEGFPAGLLKVESEVLDTPLRAMLLVVVLGILLHSDIRQMDEHVVQLSDIRGVLLVTETSEP